jgi:hypothetical protein
LKTQAAEAESCPLAKINHCSKQTASKNNLETAAVKPEQQSLDCCSFLPLVFNKAVNIEKTQKVEKVAASVKISQPAFSIINRLFPAQRTFRSIIINRENTHLKNCIFRI